MKYDKFFGKILFDKSNFLKKCDNFHKLLDQKVYNKYPDKNKKRARL